MSHHKKYVLDVREIRFRRSKFSTLFVTIHNGSDCGSSRYPTYYLMVNGGHVRKVKVLALIRGDVLWVGGIESSESSNRHEHRWRLAPIATSVVTLKASGTRIRLREGSDGRKDCRRRQGIRCNAHGENDPLLFRRQTAPDEQVNDLFIFLLPNKVDNGMAAILDLSFLPVSTPPIATPYVRPYYPLKPAKGLTQKLCWIP